ncbi:MAG: hypothetical protein M1816_000012 [Peltula sp. TS41687]|nr:MAG: hypothetical protein M1816_000012 [Peltula sp. TS41687]
MAILRREDSGGILRGPLPADNTRTSILVAMLTIAIYQAAVVDLKVFTTFKRRNTLYFWSLLIASWGIISHSTGIILKWFVGRCPWYVNTAFATFGWWGMVTGQSLVLYSRLHLVVRDERILRAVFIMIITNFLIFQVPTTVLTFGSNQANPGLWLKVYNVYERIQLIIFTLQETIISIIYIRSTLKLLQPTDPEDTRHTKKFLIYLNILVIILDIAFVIEVYSGEWVYKTGTQSLAYSIKLTIEFIVLNKLMDVFRFGHSSWSREARLGSSRNSVSYTTEAATSDRPRLESTTRSGNRLSSQFLKGWHRGKSREGPFEKSVVTECEPVPSPSGSHDLGRDSNRDTDLELGPMPEEERGTDFDR